MTTATQQLHETYRREARRVRGRLRARPGEMYAALQALARRADAGRLAPQTPNRSTLRAIPGPAPHAGGLEALAEAHFDALVRERVSGPVLRYSVRQELLQCAECLGIGRFQASLVIATVQHERRHLLEPATPEPADGGIVLPLVAAGILQAAILLGAWWVLR